jgi:hypothetical protein
MIAAARPGMAGETESGRARRLPGLFNSNIGELYEMLYQSDAPYFDSSKFAKAFGFFETPYTEFGRPLPLLRSLRQR